MDKYQKKFTQWEIGTGQEEYARGLKLLEEYLGETVLFAVGNYEWLEALRKWCEV